jgi:hypothetical protein
MNCKRRQIKTKDKLSVFGVFTFYSYDYHTKPFMELINYCYLEDLQHCSLTHVTCLVIVASLTSLMPFSMGLRREMSYGLSK